MLLKVMFLAAGLLLAVSTCFSDILTFDGLPDSGGLLLCTGGVTPNGYGGLNWNNFGYVNATVSPCSVEGYGTALTSPPNVGFNEGGNPASITSATPFTLLSGDFAAAWNDGLTVAITAKLGATTVGTLDFTLNTTTRTLETFSFGQVTELDFSSSGGIENPNLVQFGGGNNFAFDNLAVNAVPEPRSILLLAFCIGAMSLVRGKLSRL